MTTSASEEKRKSRYDPIVNINMKGILCDNCNYWLTANLRMSYN